MNPDSTKPVRQPEALWPTTTEPYDMVPALLDREPRSERKLRLLACAYARRVWHRMADEASRRAVQVAEQFADGRTGGNDLWRAYKAAEEVRQAAFTTMQNADRGSDQYWQASAAYDAAFAAARTAEEDACLAFTWVTTARVDPPLGGQHRDWPGAPADLADLFTVAGRRRCRAEVCDVVREIIGNPFRPLPTIDPGWLLWDDKALPRFARRIYDCRLFEDLPFLADDLAQAGCDSADLLTHLRSPGPHDRGCWALDLILGKT
jgi:hypothetical protein